jgi:hypothetical protein
VTGDHRRAWLGAGVITLGVGAALATGAGVAHADDTASPRPHLSSSAGTAAGSPKAKLTYGGSHTATPIAPLRLRTAVLPSAATTGLTISRGSSPGTGHARPTVTARSRSTLSVAASPAAPTAEAAQATVPVLPAAATPRAPALPTNPVVGLVTEVVSALNTLIVPNPAVPPQNSLQLLVFEVVRRIEIDLRLPVVGTVPSSAPDPVIGTNPVSTSAGPPNPDDVVDTPYGAIGKWLLQSNGKVANFGGQQFLGKKLVEPINIIILDPTSTSAAQSTQKLNADLSQSGFPVQLAHTTGFKAIIGGQTLSQHPSGVLEGYSDNFFLLPDDHVRTFGPVANADGVGYVWTASASREQAGLFGLLPTHVYVSFDQARDELASRLILGGDATLVGIIAMSNAYDEDGRITGDHDGYAIVIQLNN